MAAMRVLVVGGTGLIGWHTARELLRRGHAVTAMARRRPPAGSLPPGAGHLQADMSALDGGALAGFDAVVHAAGSDYRNLAPRPALDFYRRINVDASARLFAAARKAGARRAVFVTTYYHAVRPELARRHPYVASRAESEPAAFAAAGAELELVVVQPPYVLGAVPGRAAVGPAIARYVRSPAPLLAPPGGTNWIGVTALAEAIATALERGRPGARYLVGDEDIAWADLVARFALAAGRARPVRVVPRPILRAAAGGIALYARLAGKEAGVRPRDWIDVVCDSLYYDPSGPAAELGHRRGDIDQEIRALVTS